MRIAWIDVSGGVTAESLLAALREAGAPRARTVRDALRALRITRVHASALPLTPGLKLSALRALKGWPVRAAEDADITAEGVALLASLASPEPPPDMMVEAVGADGGVRVVIGSAADPRTSDLVWLIETNLDNVSGEVVGWLFERLFEVGALDVFSTPIQMKKSRPAIQLSALAAPSRRAAVEELLLVESPTFGVRARLVERAKLAREESSVGTPYGRIRVKVGRLKGRVVRVAPEYEDVRAAALKHRVPLATVHRAATAGRYRK